MDTKFKPLVAKLANGEKTRVDTEKVWDEAINLESTIEGIQTKINFKKNTVDEELASLWQMDTDLMDEIN